MGIFNWLGGFFNGFNNDDDTADSIGSDDIIGSGTTINPASGLPMISGDTSGVDVGGNPYGMDDSDDFSNSGDSFINSDNDFGNNDSFSNDSFNSFGSDDSFDSGSSGFGDDF
jgi:hypothetical protein